MIHNVFNFIENLIMHVDFLLHGDSPHFKLQCNWLRVLIGIDIGTERQAKN